jgi:uncharacterized SAM-binding protein YcdF (DUF218 family)
MKRPRVKRILAVYLIVTGIVANVFVIWMAAGWPIGFDRWLVVREAPRKADYIVCLAGGLGGNNIPTEDGWDRIYTAAQLWFDGYAPKIVFTGGGAGKISESEVYAGSAIWFGCPEEALFFEPDAAGTADHPAKLLEPGALGIRKDAAAGTNIGSQSAGTGGNKAEADKDLASGKVPPENNGPLTREDKAAGAAGSGGKRGATDGLGIRRDTPLIIVTSPLHSRRVAMVFRKAGFTDFRVVTGWSARTTRDPAKVRALMTSKFVGFRPSGKNYGDVLNRLKWETSHFFNALREAAAIVIYKIKGKA